MNRRLLHLSILCLVEIICVNLPRLQTILLSITELLWPSAANHISSKACSNFHLPLIAFLFLLTTTSISLPVILPFPSPLSSFSSCFQTFLSPLCSLFPVFPTSDSFRLTLTAKAGSLHLSSLDAKCLLYQSHFLIHSFPRAAYWSVTAQHPRSTPLTLSLWWLIPSVTRLSHTLTKPSHFHQSVNPFKRESGFLLCWYDCEVRPRAWEGRRGKGRLCQNRHKCHATKQQQ